MKKFILTTLITILSVCYISSVSADGHKGGVKVYWGTSGFFGPFDIRGLIPSLPADQSRDITIPISMFVIDHPKGLIVYDSGNNVAISDTLDNCKAYWAPGLCDFLQPTQTRGDVIDSLLKQLGYSAADVKAVITSHAHLDHAGNIEMFPDAIHIFQKKELYQGWWPEKFQGREGMGPFVMADLDNARDFNYLELEGDYDVFGDGLVKILSTPGHTLGHQSVRVATENSGVIIIAQDAIWMQENLDGYPAGLNYSVKDYTDSVTRLKMMRDLQGAPLFMGHDENQFASGGNKWY